MARQRVAGYGNIDTGHPKNTLISRENPRFRAGDESHVQSEIYVKPLSPKPGRLRPASSTLWASGRRVCANLVPGRAATRWLLVKLFH